MTGIALFGTTGVEEASRILGKAGFLGGFESQVIINKDLNGFYPVSGFVRFEKKKIVTRDVKNPDFVIIFDNQLITAAFEGNKDGFSAIINSPKPLLIKRFNTKNFIVDADGISKGLGKPVSNFVMLGAFAKIFGKLPLRRIKEAAGDIHSCHTAADEGYKNVKRMKL